MRNWRVLTAVVAVVLAGLAGVLAWQYLSDADERAKEDAELVEVVVAAADIARGTGGNTVLADDLLTTTQVPRDARPDDALEPGDEDSIAGLVAAGPISEGQFILTDSFLAAGQVSGFAGVIGEGMQAVSISVDDTRGIGGFLQPDDRVNVILNLDLAFVEGGTPDAAAVNTSAYLLPGLKVLAVGDTTATTTRTADGTTESRNVSAGIITFEVNDRQALQLVQAAQNGTIWLSLNPPGFDPVDDFTGAEEIVEAVNLFDQPLSRVRSVQEQLRTGG